MGTTVVEGDDDAGDGGNVAGAAYAAGRASATAEHAEQEAEEATETAEGATEQAESATESAARANETAWSAQDAVYSLEQKMDAGFAAVADALQARQHEGSDGDQGDGEEHHPAPEPTETPAVEEQSEPDYGWGKWFSRR